eukprot:6901440-Prymnesium_polylepis.1
MRLSTGHRELRGCVLSGWRARRLPQDLLDDDGLGAAHPVPLPGQCAPRGSARPKRGVTNDCHSLAPILTRPARRDPGGGRADAAEGRARDAARGDWR